MEVGEKDLKKKDRKRIILATTPDGKVIKINAKSTKHKYTGADIAFYIADYLFFIIFTISCIFPFYYIFINTISDAKLVNSGSINFIPRGLNIQNYIQLKNVIRAENRDRYSPHGTGFSLCRISYDQE